MAIFSQIEKLDWTGKKVIGLMTHEGSGLGASERDLKKFCVGASFGKCLAIYGGNASNSEAEVSAWAKEQVKQKFTADFEVVKKVFFYIILVN